ncbi:hypothetical protein GCM10022225_77290 [Plantactinospora mayteni]|uniref:Uncharacterized protein n=1 Tax=Plantactinospora mayteni TaxID=566021 RepID=A0ABQ4F2L8_9ACTN|nr:hypothetical protein [Plantactinospora mayteni]GIH01162.1 hypothetical protein Pma05_77340 [Plantactinospora mayteni]
MEKVSLPDRAEIAALLRRLDDPIHLEYPARFNCAAEQRRFQSLIAELGQRFGCTCEAESGRQVQDASYLGQLVIQASATANGMAIFVRVSNFDGLALLGAEGPGRYDDAETPYLIAETDRGAVLEVLAELNYAPLLEDALSAGYDGTSGALRGAYPSHPPTWFIRYFDYL